MNSDDDEQLNITSAGNIADHNQRYKHYLKKLKQGQSSGISQQFGRASDLLPAEALEPSPAAARSASSATTADSSTTSSAVTSAPAARPSEVDYKVGERLWSQSPDNDLRSAVEDLIAESARTAVPLGTVIATGGGGELEVVGSFVEDGEQKYMMSDMSVMTGAEVLAHLNSVSASSSASSQPAEAKQSPVQSQPEPPPEPPKFFTSSASYSNSYSNMSGNVSGTMSSSTSSTTTSSPGHVTGNATHTAFAASTQFFSVDNVQPDLKVTTVNGTWLWDVYYEGEDIRHIEMSEGGLIARTEDGKTVLVRRRDGAFPSVIALESVIVHPLTGNIYWQGSGGKIAGAFLNNDWQIDQQNDANLNPAAFLVTEPRKSANVKRNHHVVSDLVIDLDSGDVTYEIPESGASMTLRSRKIFS